jgi:hypothetical protein
MNDTPSELWILTRVINDADPHWNESVTITGTRAQISKVVDLSKGIPYGWRLLRGKKARRFLKWSLREEMRWRAEQQTKRNAGGLN